VDEFFYKPYEPSVSVATTEPANTTPPPARKRAVLLDGAAITAAGKAA